MTSAIVSSFSLLVAQAQEFHAKYSKRSDGARWINTKEAEFPEIHVVLHDLEHIQVPMPHFEREHTGFQ